MEFSARRRGEIHEGSVPFLPASMDCAPQDLERLFARPFRLSGHIVCGREECSHKQPAISCQLSSACTFGFSS